MSVEARARIADIQSDLILMVLFSVFMRKVEHKIAVISAWKEVACVPKLKDLLMAGLLNCFIYTPLPTCIVSFWSIFLRDPSVYTYIRFSS